MEREDAVPERVVGHEDARRAHPVAERRELRDAPAVARIGEDDVIVTPSGALVRASDGKVLAEDDL